MKLNRTGSVWNRNERNKINDNWDKLEGNVNDFQNEITDKVFTEIKNSAKLNWGTPVNNFSELPSNSKEGDTHFTRDTGKVYRYDGKTWKEIQEIDAGPVNEVDSRLSSQLADIDNLESYELNSKKRMNSSYVVFISDDAHIGDWNTIKPIFESLKVPFCFAVPTSWMAQGHAQYETRMSWEQARYLQNKMGCEALSHSHSHNSPVNIPDMDINGVKFEYSESKRILEEQGLRVESYRVPNNRFTTRERVLAKEFYRSMVISNYGSTEGLNITPLEQYELKSLWIGNVEGSNNNFDYFKAHIDKVVEKGGLLIISTHGYDLNGLEGLLTDIVTYSINNSNVVTLKEALDNIGNIVDVGDFTKHSSGYEGANRKQKNVEHYVVGADGIVSGSYGLAEDTRFNPMTPYKEFPKGVTAVPVYASNAEGSPYGTAGVLVNHRLDDDSHGFNYQLYYDHNRKFSVQRRDVVEGFNFSDWYSAYGIDYPFSNNFNTKNKPKDFPVQTTFSRILSNNPDVDDTPTKGAGLLMTVIVDRIGTSPGYNYQEFTSFRSNVRYRRPVIDENTFGGWSRDESKVTHQLNSFDCSTPYSAFAEGDTESIVLSSSPNISHSPNSLGGLLKTNKIVGDYFTLSHQYYHTFDGSQIFYRKAINLTDWGTWRKIEMTLVTSD